MAFWASRWLPVNLTVEPKFSKKTLLYLTLSYMALPQDTARSEQKAAGFLKARTGTKHPELFLTSVGVSLVRIVGN